MCRRLPSRAPKNTRRPKLNRCATFGDQSGFEHVPFGLVSDAGESWCSILGGVPSVAGLVESLVLHFMGKRPLAMVCEHVCAPDALRRATGNACL